MGGWLCQLEVCRAEYGHCLWGWEHLRHLPAPVQGSEATDLAFVAARSGSSSWQTVYSLALGVDMGVWTGAAFSRMLASTLPR